MTDYTNGYFQMMKDIGTGYEAARQQRRNEKEALMKAKAWGTEVAKRWNDREESFPFPFSAGYMKAYRAWENTNAKKSCIEGHADALDVQDLPWDKDVHDFVNCLKEAGVKEIAITDESTALMRILHNLTDNDGCKLTGLCKVIRTEDRWGMEGPQSYNGILMQIG